MNLNQKIEHAFAERKRPEKLINHHATVTPEQEDALWFTGRDWRAVSREEWDGHWDAFFTFTPEAFAYYLPSILTLTVQSPAPDFLPADALLKILDRSPAVESWDDFLITRLGGLRPAECEVLKEWTLYLASNESWASQYSLGRAFDTAELLQKRAR
jgi:hypothetical protein